MQKLNYYYLLFVFLSVILLFGCAGTAFDTTKLNNSIVEYDKFIEEYRDSKYIEEAFFLRAQKMNLIQSYDEYLHFYPKGKFYKKALKAKEELLFRIALRYDTTSMYCKYIEEFPQGNYITTIKKNLELATWNETTAMNRLEDYINFINNYPNSNFLYEAQKRRKEIIQDITKYGDYYYKNPVRTFSIKNPNNDLYNNYLYNNYFIISTYKFEQSERTNIIQLWNHYKGNKILELELSSKDTYVHSLNFSHDDTFIAIVIGNIYTATDIEIWNLFTGEKVRHFSKELLIGGIDFDKYYRRINENLIKGSYITHDNKYLLVLYDDVTPHGRSIKKVPSLRLFRLSTGTKVWSLAKDKNFRTLAFSKDGKQFAIGGNDGTIRVFNIYNGTLNRKWKAYKDSKAVIGISFSPNDKYLVSWCNIRNDGYNKYELTIWNYLKKTAIHKIRTHKKHKFFIFSKQKHNYLVLEDNYVWDIESKKKIFCNRNIPTFTKNVHKHKIRLKDFADFLFPENNYWEKIGTLYGGTYSNENIGQKFELYVTPWADSVITDLVNQEIRKDFETAKIKNSIIESEMFIQNYPNAPQKDIMLKNIQNLKRQKALNSNKPEMLVDFIRVYPDDPEQSKIRNEIVKLFRRYNSLNGYVNALKWSHDKLDAKKALKLAITKEDKKKVEIALVGIIKDPNRIFDIKAIDNQKGDDIGISLPLFFLGGATSQAIDDYRIKFLVNIKKSPAVPIHFADYILKVKVTLETEYRINILGQVQYQTSKREKDFEILVRKENGFNSKKIIGLGELVQYGSSNIFGRSVAEIKLSNAEVNYNIIEIKGL